MIKNSYRYNNFEVWFIENKQRKRSIMASCTKVVKPILKAARWLCLHQTSILFFFAKFALVFSRCYLATEIWLLRQLMGLPIKIENSSQFISTVHQILMIRKFRLGKQYCLLQIVYHHNSYISLLCRHQSKITLKSLKVIDMNVLKD